MTMPRAITSPELALLRKNGQWSRLYLAVHVPKSIYTARLAALPSSDDMVAEITYTSGSGTLGNVRAGMTMYIGTSAGAHDLGMVRIRKSPVAGTFYIGEISKIDWQSSAYLTVVEDYDLWARHIKMSGDDVLMDYDVTYSNQHTVFNPVPVLGAHRVVKLTGASVNVTLGADTANGQASWVFDSTISSYSWTVPDAIGVTGGTTANPVATFNSVGWHACYCTVTSAAGASKTGMRWVYIYDDDNMPTSVFEMSDYIEDYQTGGVSCSVTLYDDASLSELRERSLVILFSDDYYGEGDDVTNQSIGQVTHCENIRLIGRIGDEQIDYNEQFGTVSVSIYNHQYWLSKIAVTPFNMVIGQNTPSTWNEMSKLNVDRGIWHVLEWRCNATMIMDVTKSGNALYSPSMDANSGTIWEMINDFISKKLLGYVCVDQFGRLFIETEPQMLNDTDRAGIPTVMTITKNDIQNSVIVDTIKVSDIGTVDLSSNYIDQFGGSALTYFSLSPGHISNEYGSYYINDLILAGSQSDCNQKAGLLYGWKTGEYKNINIHLSANNNMVSCFPKQYVVFSIEATDSPRGLSETLNCIPRRRSILFDNSTGAWDIQIEIEPETFEQNAVAYIPPAGDDISIPPAPPLFPPLPGYLPVFPSDVTGSDAPPVVVIGDDENGILYTLNFNADSPTWQFWNFGIDTADVQYLFNFVWDSNANWLFRVPNGGWYAVPIGADKIYYASTLGARWTKLDLAAVGLPDSPSTIRGIGWNPTKSDEVAVVTSADSNTHYFYLGNHSGFTLKSSFGAYGGGRGGLTYGAGIWVFDHNWAAAEFIITFDAAGTPIAETSSFGAYYGIWHVRAGTSATLFKVVGNHIYRSDDNAVTWDDIDLTANGFWGNIHVSPDGQVLMGGWDLSARRGRSLDGGYSWNGSFFTYGDYYCYAYCGGASSSSRWILGRGYVRYSDDAGATWEAKEGNLPYLIPVGMAIYKILVPGYINT